MGCRAVLQYSLGHRTHLHNSVTQKPESYCLIYMVDTAHCNFSGMCQFLAVCWASPELYPPFLAGCLSTLQPWELQEEQGGREGLVWKGKQVFSWGGSLVAWPVLGLMG